MELLCQGAEGRILKTTFLGRPAILKERFVKKYRHPQLDETLSRERLRAETRSLVKCRSAGLRVPSVYFVDIANRCLVLEYFQDSSPARLHILKLQTEQNATDLVALMRNVGQKLAVMHSNNVIHGDLTTSNILVLSTSELVLIDFGLSYIDSAVEDKAVDLYVLERAFLSTHPNTQELFDQLLDSYAKECGKVAEPILKKLDEVRLRGRKREMIG